jgi:predicted regulator of Ras-like GTPase activity (Roadblock/LC7/MglB family)
MMVKEQIAQLATVSGVIGCGLLARDGAVLLNMMPEFISPGEARKAADAVVEAMLGLETLEEGVWEIDMAFAEVLCVIRPVGTSILMLLCDPDANLPMLKMNVNVAAKRIAAAPAHELTELRAAAEATLQAERQAEPIVDDSLPVDAVKAVIAAIREQLAQSDVSDAMVDQILGSTGLNLEAPTRPSLRAALNDILEKGISRSMGRAEATRWLNQLVKQHGLTKPGA